jgi:glycosyltransferase involved in cell wall biosynthesis
MKISIIMQSYLGEYPGSRSDSDKKFLRAVQSFIDQTNKDSELIIVSDGCEITHKLYYEHFKSNDRIKYAYVDKDTRNMYEGEQKYYRGLPRQVGRSLVTGDVTAYMDSDDYIIKDTVNILKSYWVNNKDLDWLINKSWYNNIYGKFNKLQGQGDVFHDPKDVKPIKIEGLPSEWYAVKVINDIVITGTAFISHKSSCTTKWEDTIGAISEDTYFNKRLRKKYTSGGVYYHPYYVRCHYSNLWDY